MLENGNKSEVKKIPKFRKLRNSLKKNFVRNLLIFWTILLLALVFYLIKNNYDTKNELIEKIELSKIEKTRYLISQIKRECDRTLFFELNSKISHDLENYPHIQKYARENKINIFFSSGLNDRDSALVLDDIHPLHTGWMIMKVSSCKFSNRLHELYKNEHEPPFEISKEHDTIPKELLELWEVIKKYVNLFVTGIVINEIKVDTDGRMLVEITNYADSDIYGFNNQYLEMFTKKLKSYFIRYGIKKEKFSDIVDLCQTQKIK